MLRYVELNFCDRLARALGNISNTRNSVSSGYPNTEKRVDEIRGVWIADETLSPVFDISSQSKQKRKSKQKSKIVKIYAN